MNSPKLLTVLLLAVHLMACAFNKSTMPGMMIPGDIGMDRLTRQDYAVLGQAVGNGCATYVALWPLPIWWVKTEAETGDLDGMRIYGIGIEAQATASALYRAIESVPNADAMLSPRIRVDGESGALWYQQACATVKGKAIRIKTDSEQRADKVESLAPANSTPAAPAPAQESLKPTPVQESLKPDPVPEPLRATPAQPQE